MKLNLILCNTGCILEVEAKIEIQVSGKETLGWLLVKSAMTHNIIAKCDGNQTRLFRNFKMATNHYSLRNGPCLDDVSFLKKTIQEHFSDGSKVYFHRSQWATPYTSENPIHKDEIVIQEYIRVQSLIDNPITPNTLKNITLGFIKNNPADYSFRMNGVLPRSLIEDFNEADATIGNPISCHK